ncbi:MAG: hypothetical protein RIA71_11970 [Oceanicaulis sp.]
MSELVKAVPAILLTVALVLMGYTAWLVVQGDVQTATGPLAIVGPVLAVMGAFLHARRKAKA